MKKIKQSILLVIVLSISFNAFSSVGRVRPVKNADRAMQCFGVTEKQIVDYTKLKACAIGTVYGTGRFAYSIYLIQPYQNRFEVWARRPDGRESLSKFVVDVGYSCDLPKAINPETGICEIPPKPEDYCDKQSTKDAISTSSGECFVNYGYSCISNGDGTGNLVTSCTDTPVPADMTPRPGDSWAFDTPVSTSGGSWFADSKKRDGTTVTGATIGGHPKCKPTELYYYPECQSWPSDYWPADDGIPIPDFMNSPYLPTGAGNLDSGTPLPDSAAGSEILPGNNVAPEVTEAAKELLTAVTHMNSDNNKNFAGINTKLNQLNNGMTAINQNITKQMQQDFDIYREQRARSDAQTKHLASVTNNVGKSLFNQIAEGAEGTVSAIQGMNVDTNLRLASLGNRLNHLSDDLGSIANKICDPRIENCEGKHGLTPQYVNQIFSEMDTSLSAAVSSNESKLLSSVQDLITTPAISSDEPNFIQKMIVDAFPTIGSCQSFVFNIGGRTVVIDCKFSTQAKALLSWLFFIYTAITVFGIVTEEITPVQSAPSTMRRRFG